eukprot:UN1238
MDIQAAEFDVLMRIQAVDWARISSLHVVYHLDFGDCLEPQQWESIKAVFERVQQNLVVVDSTAIYYAPDCVLGGLKAPRRLSVNYVQEALCQGQA